MAAERHSSCSDSQPLPLPPHSLSLPSWQYELHLYLDYGFPATMLQTVVPALQASFPFFRLTHSQLSPLQHLSLLLDCWQADRWQLNALNVIDVLQQQWETVGTVTAAATTEASSTRQRKRRREGEEREQSSAARPLPASANPEEPLHWQHSKRAKSAQQVTPSSAILAAGLSSKLTALDGSSRQTGKSALPATASPLFPVSVRLSVHRRADYVIATRYSAASSTRLDRSTALVPPLSALHIGQLRSLLGSTLYEHIADGPQSNVDPASRTVQYSLFLTEYDCYVPGLSFVFGVARVTRCGLVSLHRLGSRSPEATAAFLAKECVHEVGHLFSLVHCALPCVMTYSTTVADARRKDAHLCPSCVAKLQWMQRGLIIKPARQHYPLVGSVDAAAEVAPLPVPRASYR